MFFQPVYKKTAITGALENLAFNANAILSKCDCCPNNCKVNRVNGELGICKSGYYPVVSSYGAHKGEEPLLSGTMGAGNIFFANCNLSCIYCQNFEISQNWEAESRREISFEKLAKIALFLQEQKCHNVGLVSPSHFIPQIIKAIYIAEKNGLNLPIIYNSNGYDSIQSLKILDGIIDIYLPDFKYGSDENALIYSNARNYFKTASAALKEMFRQVGDNYIIEDGVLKRGIIIRHLVLPNNLSESEKVLDFISNKLSPKVYVSVMSQYYPAHKAADYPLMSRTIRASEYDAVLSYLEKFNLKNGWIQELESHQSYRPEFNKSRKKPFRF